MHVVNSNFIGAGNRPFYKQTRIGMDSSLINISALMINSREKIHPDWVQTARQSIENQFRVPDETVIVENLYRQKTVGECLNEGVQKAKGDYIIFIDDDDWWARDYVMILEKYVQVEPNYIAWTSRGTIYMDRYDSPHRGRYSPSLNRIHRGIWRKDYLLKYPYNEELTKGIDREHIEETGKRGDPIFVINHYYGYYYRKHSDYACTN